MKPFAAAEPNGQTSAKIKLVGIKASIQNRTLPWYPRCRSYQSSEPLQSRREKPDTSSIARKGSELQEKSNWTLMTIW
jgi:hypothetical protein